MPAPESRTVSSIGLRIPCVHLLLAFLAPGVERIVHRHSVLHHLVIFLKITREAEENRGQPAGLRSEVEASQAKAGNGAARSAGRGARGPPPLPNLLGLGGHPG